MNHSTSDALLIEWRDKMIDEYEELFHSAREMREAQARYRQARERVYSVEQLTQDNSHTRRESDENK